MKNTNEIVISEISGVLQGFDLDHKGNFVAIVSTIKEGVITENRLDLPICSHQTIEGLKPGKPTTIVKFFNPEQPSYRPAIDIRLEQ